MGGHDHWIPRYGYEIVRALVRDCGWKESTLRGLSRPQLFAIFFKEFKKLGCPECQKRNPSKA